MNFDDGPVQYEPYIHETIDEIELQKLTTATFTWMAMGMFLTFIVTSIPIPTPWPESMLILLILASVEVVLIRRIIANINEISLENAKKMLIIGSIAHGALVSSFCKLFQINGCNTSFLVMALFFVGLASYGYLSKQSICGIRGSALAGALILMGLLLISRLIEFRRYELEMAIGGLAILIFITAKNTRIIKEGYTSVADINQQEYVELVTKDKAVIVALQLYLDFINFFFNIVFDIIKAFNNISEFIDPNSRR